MSSQFQETNIYCTKDQRFWYRNSQI